MFFCLITSPLIAVMDIGTTWRSSRSWRAVTMTSCNPAPSFVVDAACATGWAEAGAARAHDKSVPTAISEGGDAGPAVAGMIVTIFSSTYRYVSPVPRSSCSSASAVVSSPDAPWVRMVPTTSD